jgi:enamine deaminase RidA (YjgF/YER057c/UK114 family)
MSVTALNPWEWQRQFSYSQALSITGATRVVYVAGQASIDPDGRVVHAGDMAAQLTTAFDNLTTVLALADLTLANVVQLNYYTTDVDTLFAAWATVTERLKDLPAHPTSTLVGVTRLAYPELLVELTAVALG